LTQQTSSAIQSPPLTAKSSAVIQFASTEVVQAYTPFIPRLLVAVDRHRRSIFAAVVVIYLLAFTGRWHPEPDSALYLTLGRNIAEGHGYTYLGQANHLAYPGLPWMLALLFKCFGPSAPFAAQLMMLAFAFLSIFLAYKLIASHAGRPMAVLCTAFLGINETFYRYGFELRNDMPFAAAVLAFLLGYHEQSRQKRWWAWPLMAVGLALAMVMRPTSWLLLPALVGAVVWSFVRRRARAQYLTIASLAIIAIAMFFLFDPRRTGGIASGYEHFIRQSMSDPAKTFARILRENLPLLLGKNGCEAILSVHLVVGLREIVSITVLTLGLFLIREHVLWGLWILMIYATLAVVEPLPRYFLPILPLLIYACWSAVARLNRRFHGPGVDWLYVALLIFVAAPNLFRITNDILFQHGCYTFSREHGWENESYTKLADAINQNTPPNATIICPPGDGRILTYLTRRQVVPPTTPLSATDIHGPLFIIDQKRPGSLDPDPYLSETLSRLSLNPAPIQTTTIPQYRQFTLYATTPISKSP